MPQSIYISYAISPKKELIISCYHDKTQSMINGAALGKADGLKPKDFIKLDKTLRGKDNADIKEGLLELLTTIKSISADYNKVIYRGDLNLCTSDKSPTPCLFDGTINDLFSGKEVHLILESGNKEYVEEGISLADRAGLTGAILQTKSTVKDQLVKVYPASIIPSPAPEELAQPEVAIKDTHSLAEALKKVGIFPQAGADSASTAAAPEVPDEDEGTKLTG
ncbi:Uncharacterised protein [Legionella wadsworthii]|uniref:Uncharacterized protein n=1 Tax=Legionella wadsworthii TaxID=28088 RepID=A0A378LQ85_9GAMM|nr:hypothetical protein [Legionella wadsworthii]STY28934.1 Uncharacterised protein [Legionella wadsworthii]